VLFVDLAETIRLSETNAARTDFVSAINETVNVSDTEAAKVDFRTALSETVGVSEVDAAYADFRVSLQEQIRVFDSFFGRLLWEIIPDDQIPGWSGLNTDIDAGWGLIDDFQQTVTQNSGATNTFAGAAMGAATFAGGPADVETIYGWIPLSNAQNTSWDNVNDDQAPTWVEIDTA
jgi:hypothetical protein